MDDSKATDNLLKFETGAFTAKCQEILGGELDAITSKLEAIKGQLSSTFDSCAKSELMKSIGHKEMYNYGAFLQFRPIKEMIANFSTFHYCGYSTVKGIDNVRNELIELFDNEKFYIWREIKRRVVSTHNYTTRGFVIFISVNAKLAVIKVETQQDGTQNPCYIYTGQFEDLGFDIPAQYLHIIEMFINQITEDPFAVYLKMLKYIRDELYCTKYVPLYAKPIMAENAQLKAQYNDYELNMAKLKEDQRLLAENQGIYDRAVEPYLCLEDELKTIAEEKKAIAEEKSRLKDIRARLLLKERALNERAERLNKIDLEAMEL